MKKDIDFLKFTGSEISLDIFNSFCQGRVIIIIGFPRF